MKNSEAALIPWNTMLPFRESLLKNLVEGFSSINIPIVIDTPSNSINGFLITYRGRTLRVLAQIRSSHWYIDVAFLELNERIEPLTLRIDFVIKDRSFEEVIKRSLPCDPIGNPSKDGPFFMPEAFFLVMDNFEKYFIDDSFQRIH